MKKCCVLLMLVLVSSLVICIGCTKIATDPEVNLTAPILVSPTNGAIITTEILTLKWHAVEKADIYEVLVDTAVDFSSSELTSFEVTRIELSIDSLASGEYSWKVRARNGDWSDVWQFIIDTEPPAVPTLATPADKAEYTSDDNQIQFNWEASDDADFYHTQVSDDINFLNIIADENHVVNSSLELNNTIGEGVFYWRVCSIDQAGNTSEWSNVLMFLVNRMMDIENNIYKIVKIGEQWWTAENLQVAHYRNGDSIQHVTGSEWARLSTGAYCIYDNNERNASTYGYLYNWYAVADSRNIAPSGWHVATDEEWKDLEMALGMSQLEADNTVWRGTNEGSKLAGRADLWTNGGLENDAAFDESGCLALPGGYCDDTDGYFHYFGNGGFFWSSTEGNTRFALNRYLSYHSSEVYRNYYNKHYGYSVRLVRD